MLEDPNNTAVLTTAQFYILTVFFYIVLRMIVGYEVLESNFFHKWKKKM